MKSGAGWFSRILLLLAVLIASSDAQELRQAFDPRQPGRQDAGSVSVVQQSAAVPTSHVAIQSPPPPAVPVVAELLKPGVVVSISGTILGSPQSFKVQWALGINAVSGWSSQGITISEGQVPPFSGVTIATWDTSSITEAGYYTIQLSAIYPEGAEVATTLIYLEPDLLSSNWPRWLEGTPGVYSTVVPTAMSGGATGLALVEPKYLGRTEQPRYRIFSADAAIDQSTDLQFGSYTSPSFGHLKSGDNGEVVVADGSAVYTIDQSGTMSRGGLVDGPPVEFQFSQVALANLSGGSSLTTIAYGIQNRDDLALIYAWDAAGQLLNSNFPIKVPYQNDSANSKGNQGMIVGDIDGDGNEEIIALESFSESTFTLGRFANDGTLRKWNAPTFEGSPSQMVLADLDGNGKLETLIAALPANGQVWELHVLQPDGSERIGWPVELDSGPPFLAAGDLARSGSIQIVVSSSDQIFVLNADGTSFSNAWPITTDPFDLFGAPVLADVDGDSYPEILVANGNYISAKPSGKAVEPFSASDYFSPVLQAFRADGTVARSWNLLGMHGEQPFYLARMTVGDFNHDGLTEIAIVNGLISGGGTSGWINEGMLEVLATGSPYQPSDSDWPMLNHDARNSATVYSKRANLSPAATPVFSQPSGTYTSAQTVLITDSTPGAVIYYTSDGTAPAEGSSLYNGPITVSSSEIIQAIATAPGFSQSATASADYIINPPVIATPNISGISPAYVSAGSPAFTLTVTGTGFSPGSVVYWASSALATQFVSETQLSARVEASNAVKAGAYPLTIQIPPPGGGVSNRFQFEVDSVGSGTSDIPSFASNSVTVAAGATANYPVTLSSSATSITALCLNLPAGSNCSYSSTAGALAVSTSPTTPTGTYQITVVFSETLPGAAEAFVIFPVLLLPFASSRRKSTSKAFQCCALLVIGLLVCVNICTGCGTSRPGPQPSGATHQVTSSGVVSLIVK